MELNYCGFRIAELSGVISDLCHPSSVLCLLIFDRRLTVSPSLRVIPLCLVEPARCLLVLCILAV